MTAAEQEEAVMADVVAVLRRDSAVDDSEVVLVELAVHETFKAIRAREVDTGEEE